MYTRDDRITCSLCAWRGSCAKKFSKPSDVALHCTDYTRDITIRDKKKKEEPADDKTGDTKNETVEQGDEKKADEGESKKSDPESADED